jgi:pilus assembly protein Flp/PilA
MKNLVTRVRNSVSNRRGATMAEYAILVAVIAIVVLVGARALGGSVNTRFQNTSNAINAG